MGSGGLPSVLFLYQKTRTFFSAHPSLGGKTLGPSRQPPIPVVMILTAFPQAKKALGAAGVWFLREVLTSLMPAGGQLRSVPWIGEPP